MTEEDWHSESNPGPMLEHLKRRLRVAPRARGRKFRLTAVEFLRLRTDMVSNPRVARAVEAGEAMCDGAGTLPDVSAILAEAGLRADPSDLPGWGFVLKFLLSPDSFTAAHEIAGLTHRVRWPTPGRAGYARDELTMASQAWIIRDVFGNPFRPATCPPSWRTSAAGALAESVYEARDFAAMPVLADALEEAGCDDADVLTHCRGPGPHVRGCWVVDLVLGKA